MSAPAPARTAATRREPWKWYLPLILPFIGTLWVPFYNHADPSLGGVPFFYWYLILWIVIAAALNGVIYLVIREKPSR